MAVVGTDICIPFFKNRSELIDQILLDGIYGFSVLDSVNTFFEYVCKAVNLPRSRNYIGYQKRIKITSAMMSNTASFVSDIPTIEDDDPRPSLVEFFSTIWREENSELGIIIYRFEFGGQEYGVAYKLERGEKIAAEYELICSLLVKLKNISGYTR